jgi:hypothetical protein
MEDDAIRHVTKFKYLRSIFTEDGKNKDDIKRIKEDKLMFNNKQQLLCSNNIRLKKT